MTALTYTATVPVVGGSFDTWGGILNIGPGQILADLQMLNTSPTARILGRNDGGTGEVERLTGTEVTAMLVPVTGDVGSGGVQGLVPAPATGDAASRKILAASGAWALPDIRASGLFDGSTGATVLARGVSVTRTGTGLYTVALSPAMPNANYIACVGVETAFLSAGQPSVTSKSTSGFSVATCRNNPGGTAVDSYDPTHLSIAIIVI